MAQALPRNINLAAQKPKAVPSYVRRFKNIQTNSSGINGEQQDIIIPIDTGTPGAFLDCQQSFVQFDLTITNGNPYIDYQNFGRAGANSLFETMTIRNNGNPIETIRDYNTAFETYMSTEGIAQEEFSMFMSRKNAASDIMGIHSNHIDFCKAPMVDRSGRIMGSTSGVVAVPVGGSVLPTGMRDPNSNFDLSTKGFGSAEKSWVFDGYAWTNTPWENTYVNTMPNQQVRNIPSAPGMNSDTSAFPSSDNIIFWPQIIGTELPDESIYAKSSLRFQDYMTFLSNVKCIPIGCTTTLVPPAAAQYAVATGGWTAAIPTSSQGAYNAGIFTVTVCVPLMSGLIGFLADKMAPVMLLDSLQLVLTTTSYGKAFKVTMDPCRRIVGTHRDFSVYGGNQLGSIDGAVGANAYGNQFLASKMVQWGTMNYQYHQTWTFPAGVTPVNGTAPQSQQGAILTPLAGATGTAYTYTVTPLAGSFPQTIGGGNRDPYPISGQPVTDTPSSQVSVNNYFPKGSGVPQYYHNAQQSLGTFPINYSNISGDIGNDMYGCYGTFLESSVPQTARCIQNTSMTGTTGYGYTPIRVFTDTNQGAPAAMPKFNISNAYFVATQVIIPDEIVAEILMAATSGDISLQTRTVLVYNNIQMTANSPSQNIIIPAKAGSANTLHCIFRTNEQTAYGPKQYLVNSLTGICPIGSSVLTADNVNYIGTNQPPNNGTSTNYVSAISGAFSFQLKIGNDLIPSQPINSGTELLIELEKCQHGLNARYNNMSFGNPLIQNPTSQSSSPGQLVYDIFTHGGYFTTYVDPFMLNDQTIVNNAKWSFCSVSPDSSVGGVAGQYATVTTNTWFPTPVGNYLVNRFVHPDGGFIVGIDLDTWSGMSDVALSGRYLGNNTVSLACEGLQLVRDIALGNNQNSVNMTAILMVDARWSLQAGGNSQLFT